MELHTSDKPGTPEKTQQVLPGEEPSHSADLFAGSVDAYLAMKDPIVEEVRQIRRDLLAEFDGDFGAYGRDVMRQDQQRRAKAASSK
ncbi:hypothetical protein OAF27_03550 [Verrucomicrobiales bacterium]|nr:hypothetical protein [Verrucomicrobiales bacterium]